MSILNVEHLSHGFGDRAIFEDVSFRLLKGEHIGLVGANGEGKSTFMNIVTGARHGAGTRHDHSGRAARGICMAVPEGRADERSVRQHGKRR